MSKSPSFSEALAMHTSLKHGMPGCKGLEARLRSAGQNRSKEAMNNGQTGKTAPSYSIMAGVGVLCYAARVALGALLAPSLLLSRGARLLPPLVASCANCGTLDVARNSDAAELQQGQQQGEDVITCPNRAAAYSQLPANL